MPNEGADDRPDDPFEIVDDTSDATVEDERERREAELAEKLAERDAHLDQRHIKAILAEKKALYRHGTYMTIAAAVMIVVAVQLVYFAIADLHVRTPMRVGSFAVIAVGLAVFAVHFVRRSLQLRREAAATTLPQVVHDPDFSALSDGSQFAENLQHMHDRSSDK
jgi:hypothetical protein